MKRLALFTAFLAAGCSRSRTAPPFDHITPKGPGAEWIEKDFSDVPNHGYGVHAARGVAREDIIPIVPELEARAVAELGSVTLVKLTEDQFRLYTGRPGFPPNRSTAYLARGVTVGGSIPDAHQWMYYENEIFFINGPMTKTGTYLKKPFVLTPDGPVRRAFVFISQPG